MPSYKERSQLIKALSEQQYFDAQIKKDASESVRIGDRDGTTGRYQILHQDGGVTRDGIKTFNQAAPQDGFVRLIGGKALDHRNKKDTFNRVITSELIRYPIVKIGFTGGSFQPIYCEDTDTFFFIDAFGIKKAAVTEEPSIEVTTANIYIDSMVYAPAVKKIYAVSSNTLQLFVIDPLANTIVSTISISNPLLSSTNGFKGILYIPETNRLYFGAVGSANNNYLIIFNPETNLIESTHEITEWTGLGYSPLVAIQFCPKTVIRNTKILFTSQTSVGVDLYKFGFFDVISKTYSLYTSSVGFVVTLFGRPPSVYNETAQTLLFRGDINDVVSVDIDTGAVLIVSITVNEGEEFVFTPFYFLDDTVYLSRRKLSETLVIDGDYDFGVTEVAAVGLAVKAEYSLRGGILPAVTFDSTSRKDNRLYIPGADYFGSYLVPYNLDTNEFS